MTKQLQHIRDFIAKNAERGSDGVVVEKWVLDALQQLDAILANLAASGTVLVNDDNLTKEKDWNWENNGFDRRPPRAREE